MPLTPGTRLGPYEVVAPIGAGGMGEVYRAKDTRLNRVVALKVLPPEVEADPERRHRFRREAEAIAGLNHPHICTLHDVGEASVPATADGQAASTVSFLVMELVEGETLAARLARGPLPVADALRYASQIADALDKAHRQGIVHRDLKPGNVMLTKTGTKLLDFGLAKLKREALGESAMPTRLASVTAEGTILGTLQYMAPEQLEGREADARTDIFACGAVLYEMLTGRRAFEGASQASLISAILRDEPPPLSALQPVTPAALDRTVRTCLAKDPDERWQSAADLGRELRWIGEAESQAPSRALSTRLQSQSGGPPAIAVSSTLGRSVKSQIGRWAVPFAAGALATGLVMWTPSQPAPGTTAPLPRQVTFDGSAEKPVFSPDGSTLAYQVKRCSDAGQCWAELERQELASGDPLPILVTVDDDGESIRPRWFWDIAWSPDGQQLLVAAGFADKRLNGLYQIPSVGGSAIRLAPGTVTSVRYRPPLGTIVDWILFPKGLQTDTPPVWQSIDLRTHVITDHELVFPASDLQWSPDARWLALSRGSGDWLARGESNVAILSPAGEVVDTRLIPAPPGWARTRWDTNGTLLYAASRGTLVGLTVNAGTGSISGTPQEVVDTLQPPGWSEFEFDRTVGGLAAYSRYQFRTVLRVISRSNATIATELLDDSTGFKGYPALSDNGRDVAFVKQDLLGINVYVKSLATGDTRRLTDTDSNKRHPQWSPDGLLLAFVDSTDEESTRLFVVGRTGDRPRPVGRLSGISHAAPFGWGADSALLVYTAGGAVWRSNVDGGEHELLDLPQPITNAWGLTVSPDGSTLALLSHYYQGDTSILRIHTADMRDPDGGWTVRFEGNWDDWLVDGVEGAQSTFDGWVQLTLLPWREDGVLDIGYSLATGRRDVTAIWRVTLSSGQARRAIDLSGVCTGIPTVSATRDFSRVVCPQTTASRDIWIVEPPDGRGGRW